MKSDAVLRDLALLLARVGLGATLAAHGAQKLYGAFGGTGPQSAAKMMESLGFAPGAAYMRAASASEISAGALIATGTLGPVGPAMLAATMLVAIEAVHRKNGYFQSKNGYELNTMYLLLALLLANEGYGAFSVDALAGLRARTGPTLGWLVFSGGLAAGLYMLGRRTPPERSPRTIHVETGTTESKTSSA